MKKLIITLIVILVIVFAIILGLYLLTDMLNPDTIQINEINLKGINNGAYLGIYETKLVKATVTIHIYDENIYKIDLLRHENGLGKKAEEILHKVTLTNSVMVDHISGATYSSMVLLKSVEVALLKAQPKQVDLSEYKLVKLVGTIDNNSFEGIYNGVATVFRYPMIEDKMVELSISDGDMIYIICSVNKEKQNIATKIIKK
ncbi:MAG: FMN-binding protein [Clostridiales bacterium]|nr:FMN-binding protein [Clostridiales bacterium]